MTPPVAEEYTQRLHDLRAVQADFKAVLSLLKGGYRFDDGDAPGALAQLEKALGLFNAELTRLTQEWSQK